MRYRPTIVHSLKVISLIGGRQLLEPRAYRSKWHTSQLVVMEDGSTLPLLWLIASDKFGPWDPDTLTPYWINGDYTNANHDNVELSNKPAERRSRNTSYGAPAGTKEYYRAYNMKNRDKQNAYQRRRYQKIRQERIELRNLKSRQGPPHAEEPTSSEQALSDQFTKMAADLGIKLPEDPS
jgi:hypothetical protein